MCIPDSGFIDVLTDIGEKRQRQNEIAGMLVWHLARNRGICGDSDEFCKELTRIAKEMGIKTDDLASFARALLHMLVEVTLEPLFEPKTEPLTIY